MVKDMTEQKIYESIINVMNEIGAVGKSKKNTQGAGFMYRGIDDVMNALQPALIKHKVFVVPTVLNEERSERKSNSGGTLLYSRLTIKFDFFAVDGSSISATVIGEAMDSGDKATNKAMSIAFKYACFQVFCIPTEEMKDPDSETYKVGPSSVDERMVSNLKKKIDAKNVVEQKVLDAYKKSRFEDFTIDEYEDAMTKLDKR
jgi:hypothetical protein